MGKRTWFANYHSVGQHSAPKGATPISSNHRAFAWTVLVVIMLSLISLIYISVTPDDDQPDENEVTQVG
jgi:hypothetical protein